MAGRKSPCKWIERDETGRPRCEHGWAFKAGSRWRCREKHSECVRKNAQSPAAKERKRLWNASREGRMSKELHEMTRVRAYSARPYV